MRGMTWMVLTALVTMAMMHFLKIPFWLFVVVVAPLMVVCLTWLSFRLSFRTDLTPEDVPSAGYEKRLAELERETAVVAGFGFNTVDTLYLKTVPDSVTRIMKHRTEPVYFALYHFGSRKACDFVSPLEGSRSLTTSSRVDAGSSPRPDGRMLQIREGAGYQDLLAWHVQALMFLGSRGVKQKDFDIPFREALMKSIREYRDETTSRSFWPFRLVYRVLTKYGRRYCKTIEQQVREGSMRL